MERLMSCRASTDERALLVKAAAPLIETAAMAMISFMVDVWLAQLKEEGFF